MVDGKTGLLLISYGVTTTVSMTCYPAAGCDDCFMGKVLDQEKRRYPSHQLCFLSGAMEGASDTSSSIIIAFV